jgi:NADPH-dependent F420 reductase
MNIAIIGTGNIGSGLALSFGKTPHGVAVAGRSLDAARALATTLSSENGVRVQAADVPTAVSSAEIIILAVPFGAVEEIAKIADFSGKTVVDVTNPLFEDFSGLTIGFETSAAEEIQKLLPDSHVVKAFNTVFAQIYADGLNFNGRGVPTFVASDNEKAKEAVTKIAKVAGFDAVDAGPLKNARYIEPLGYLNIQFGYMLGRGTQIAPAWLSR